MRTARVMFRFFSVFIFIPALLMFGCGRDGGDPYALWKTFSHPEGVYTFHYMAPPWAFHSDSSDIHPVLIVDNSDLVSSGGLGSGMRLEAWYNGDRSALEYASVRINYWFHKGYESDGVADFINYYGDTGLIFKAGYDNHQVRELFFDCGTGTVVLSVWVKGSADTDDINLLLSGFECGDGWKI